MVFAGIPTQELRHSKAAQQLIEEGRQVGLQEGEAQGEARGRALGEASVTLRLLNRICGPLSEATTARIHALPLEQLEALAEVLLDFSAPPTWRPGCQTTPAEAQTAVAGPQRSAAREAPLHNVSRSTSTAISLR